MTPNAVPPLAVIVPSTDDPLLIESVRALLRCNHSIRAEIIVVLNGSSRQYSQATVAAFHSAEDVTVLELPRRGIAVARNAGVRHARAPKLLMFDSDCQPAASDYLTTISIALDSASIVVGPVEFLSENAALISRAYAALRNEDYRLHHLARLYSPNIGFTRSTFEGVGGYHEGLVSGEDSEMGFRLLAAGHTPTPVVRALIHHRQRVTLGRAAAIWFGYGRAKGFQVRRGPIYAQTILNDIKYVLSPLGKYHHRIDRLPSTLLLRPILAVAFQVGCVVGLLTARADC